MTYSLDFYKLSKGFFYGVSIFMHYHNTNIFLGVGARSRLKDSTVILFFLWLNFYALPNKIYFWVLVQETK